MEPIVNPYIFYIISVVNCLLPVIVGLFLSAIATIYYLLDKCDNNEDKYDFKKEDNNKNYKYIKWLLFIISILIVLFILIPDDRTMYKMLVASYATPDNIQAVQGNIIDFITKIANGIKDVK